MVEANKKATLGLVRSSYMPRAHVCELRVVRSPKAYNKRVNESAMRADGCGASELSCGRSVVIHLPEIAEISSFTTEKGSDICESRL